MNYFLFIISRHSQKKFVKTSAGVGKTSIPPGITDTLHGIMYVAPGDYIKTRALKDGTSPVNISSNKIREYIESYYLENS